MWFPTHAVSTVCCSQLYKESGQSLLITHGTVGLFLSSEHHKCQTVTPGTFLLHKYYRRFSSVQFYELQTEIRASNYFLIHNVIVCTSQYITVPVQMIQVSYFWLQMCPSQKDAKIIKIIYQYGAYEQTAPQVFY